jgi:hypothetical protein
MADVGVVYTLTTPGPDIVFNQFTDPFEGQDQYYITEIRGLSSPALRTPFDNVPLGDGGLIHDFWLGPRHIGVEGTVLVQSTPIQDDIVVIRNGMEKDLADALESILRADGTFVFTPQGESQVSYTVRYEIGLEFVHTNNYLSLDFSFGLIAGNPSG